MKRIIIVTAGIISVLLADAQTTLNSTQANQSNLNAPATAQPVPNATVTEKGAPSAKPLIAPAANPIPPIYPGGDVRLVPTQNDLIHPASPPSPTQPVQKEPLTPVESTNVLQPTRPQREENSRINKATGVQVQTGYITPANTKPVTTAGRVKPASRPVPSTNPAPTTIQNNNPSSKSTIAMKMDGSVRTAPAERQGSTGKVRKANLKRSNEIRTGTSKKL